MQFWIGAIAVIIIDQLTKWWIVGNFTLGESRNILDGFLWLTYVQNQGAAFGIMQGYAWLFMLSAVLIVLVLVWFNRNYHSKPISWTTGVIAGGAIGNIIDRWKYDHVVDFLDLGWWPVFNLADAAIVCGSFILVVLIMFNEKGAQINV